MRLYITPSHNHYTVAMWLDEDLRTALFWVITQRVVVISYRRFGQPIRRIIRVQESQRKPAAPVHSSLHKICIGAKGFLLDS
jgi:hypothetical protein